MSSSQNTSNEVLDEPDEDEDAPQATIKDAMRWELEYWDVLNCPKCNFEFKAKLEEEPSSCPSCKVEFFPPTAST